MSLRLHGTFFHLVLLLAVLACVWGSFFPLAIADLPFVHHPDEPVNLAVVHRMMADGSANPQFFNYPSFLFYANIPGQFLAQSAAETAVELDVQSPGSAFAPTIETMLYARGTSLLVHLMNVMAVFLFLRVRTGVVLATGAALLTGLTPLAQHYAFWMAPDVFATLFTTLSLMAAVRLAETGRTKAYLIAGLMAGLAAASKYNAGLVAGAIIVAHALAPGPVSKKQKACLLAVFAAILGLLAASPFLILDPNSAWAGLVYELHHYAAGHLGAQGDSFRYNLGSLVSGAGIALFIAICATTNRTAWPLIFFILVYFSFVSLQLVRFDRNLAPLMPAIALAAALGAARIGQLFARIRSMSLIVQFVLAILIAVPGLSTALQKPISPALDYNEAREWLIKSLPSGSLVVVEGYVPFIKSADIEITGVKSLVLDHPDPAEASHFVLTKRASQRFIDDPQNRSAFLDWANSLQDMACAIETYPSEKKWQLTILAFECTLHPPNEARLPFTP